MKILEILQKIGKGEELTADEKSFIAAYKEPKDLSADVTNLNAQLTALTKERDDLKNQIDTAENAKLSDVEKMQKTIDALNSQVAALTKERDDLKSASTAAEFRYGIERLAREHKCNDVEYLMFKAGQSKLDLKKADKVTEFMDTFKKESPKFFDAEVNNGGGGTPPGAENGNGNPDRQARIDELLRKGSLTDQEANEVVRLQDEIDKDNQASNN